MVEYFIGIGTGIIVSIIFVYILRAFKKFEDDYNYLVDRVNNQETYIDSQKEEITRLRNIIDNK